MKNSPQKIYTGFVGRLKEIYIRIYKFFCLQMAEREGRSSIPMGRASNGDPPGKGRREVSMIGIRFVAVEKTGGWGRGKDEGRIEKESTIKA